jgi:hypothetical protein
MKWIIERYGRLANIVLEQDARDHDVWALWQQCRAILLAVPTSDEDEPLGAVEQIVKDFHDLDKYAVALRYSKTKEGSQYCCPISPLISETSSA